MLFPICMQGLGKLVMLRARLGAAAGAVKNFFTGGKAEKDPAVVAMENLRVGFLLGFCRTEGLGF